MAMLNATRQLILAKLESQYGTDPTPTALLNAFVVENFDIKKRPKLVERKVLLPTMGKINGLNRDDAVEVTMDVEVIPSAAAGTAPGIGCLLRACAMTEAISAGVSVEYTPHSTLDGESVTIWGYHDGLLHKVRGCVGDFTLTGKVNEKIKIAFKFIGLYEPSVFAADATFPANYTLPTGTPIIFHSADFQYSSAAEVIENFELNMNNEISMRSSASAALGVSRFFVSDKAIKAKFDPELQLLATRNWFNLKDQNTAGTFSWECGPAAGSKLYVTCPNTLIVKDEKGSRNNIAIVNIEVECNPTLAAGNNQISLKFR